MPNMTTLLKDVLSGADFPEFHPHLFEDTRNDSLTCVEVDCSITEEQEPGSNIVVLRSNNTNKVVGVRIEYVSTLKHFKE